MERPTRPRPKHRSLTNKRNSLPSSTTTKPSKPTSTTSSSQNTPQRPSLPASHRKNRTQTYNRTLVQLIQSESKQEPQGHEIEEMESDIFEELSKIDARQNQRKSDFGKDLDEMKKMMFSMKQNELKKEKENEEKNTLTHVPDTNILHNNTANIFRNKKNVPTSLRLVGMRDPKSLLYHREYMNKLQQINNNDHKRAASFALGAVTTNNNNNNMASSTKGPQSSNNNFQHQSHLRSFSSIMGATPGGLNNNNNQKQNAQNIVNNNSKIKLNAFEYKQISIDQLADEYQSSDTDDDDQDDDIKC
eukprot:120376_1